MLKVIFLNLNKYRSSL